MKYERAWAILFDMSSPQKVMWRGVLACSMLILFVYVPYRMPDNSRQFGWFWSPPMISKGEIENNVAAIAKANPAAVGGAAIASVVVASQREPAPVWWSQSRSWVRIAVLIAFFLHIRFAAMKL